LGIASEYLIAATAIRGWSLRSPRNGHSADTADTARTARLQGEVNCCGAKKSDCFYKTHAAEATSCQRVTPPCSRAVRALSGVSALCPFLHERRDQPLMTVAAIKYSDAIH